MTKPKQNKNKETKINAGMDVGEGGQLLTAGSMQAGAVTVEVSAEVFNKLKINLLYNPATPLLGILQ